MGFDKTYATTTAGHEVLAGQPLSLCPVCRAPHGWGPPWKWEEGGMTLGGQRLCSGCETAVEAYDPTSIPHQYPAFNKKEL